jgi:hypothetical protein
MPAMPHIVVVSDLPARRRPAPTQRASTPSWRAPVV